MCHLSPIWLRVCGNHYDNVGQHQDKYLLCDTSALHVTSVTCVTWHLVNHLNINTEPGHGAESHFRGNLRWQIHTNTSPISHPLSTSDRETEWVLSPQYRDNGDDWSRSDQDLDNIDTIIVFSKFTTQIKWDGDEDLLLSLSFFLGGWMMVWQMFPESHADTFFGPSLTIIVPHLPSSLGGLMCNPALWLAAWLLILQSDVRIWQVSLLGGNVREGDGWAQNVPSGWLLPCTAKPTVRHQSSSAARKVHDSLSVLELLMLRWKELIEVNKSTFRC